MRSDSWAMRIWKLFYPLLIHFSVSVLFSIIFTTVALALGGGNLEDTLRLAVEYNFPVTMIADVIVLLILLYFFRKDSLRLMPVKMKITPFHWILIAVCGISCCPAANYLISLSGLIQLFYEQYEEVSSLLYYGNIWQELILMAVAAPVLEEVLFRGLIFRRLRTYCTFPAAVLVSALLFGAYHGNVVQGVYGFLMGAALAFMYERFRTIWAPILFHAAANLISVIVTEVPQVSNLADSHALAVMVIAIIAALGTIYLIQNNCRPKEVSP